MDRLTLGGRAIGPGEPPAFIAEIGANHNGDMDLARKLIDAARSCGADAVKFQSWSKRSIISRAEYARHASYPDKKRHFGPSPHVDSFHLHSFSIRGLESG